MTTKTKTKAEIITSRSNHDQEHSDGLCAWKETLYRSGPDAYHIETTVGAAMDRPGRQHLSREQAIDWIYDNITDFRTGYHFSREQAIQIADGAEYKTVGEGWREVGDDD